MAHAGQSVCWAQCEWQPENPGSQTWVVVREQLPAEVAQLSPAGLGLVDTLRKNLVVVGLLEVDKCHLSIAPVCVSFTN